MTISSTTRKAGPFTGNDSTTVFPFAFKVFSAADLYVVKLNASTGVETVLALTTDYTVNLNADQNSNPGGTVTLVAGALPTGYTLTVTSNITPLQATDLTNQGGFYPAVITNALDKLTILVQQILERLGRSLTLPLSTPSGVSASLPLPSANKVIGWNSTGDELVNLNAADLATQIVGASKTIDVFSGNGATVAFTLSSDPLTENNTDVYISGVYQQKSEYSISGTTLTFTAAPPAGTNNIEVVQAQAQTYPVTTIGSNVVGTSNIIDGAVTPAKTSGFGAWVTAASAALARTALGLGSAALSAASAFASSGAVTGSGLTMATSRLLGRTTASTGAPEEISVGAGLSLSGGTLSATGIALLTEQSTTSGSTKDFTGIPSTAKRVTIMFIGVSTSGSAVPLIRIGAGSIESSGYSCAHGQVVNGGSSVVSNAPATGFGFNGNTWSSGIVIHGKVELNLVSASTNTWTISGVVARMDGVIDLVSGSKSLSGALDRVQISTADAFDAGAINVSYE